MKTMKNVMKCFVAVFMMAIAFVAAGTTAEAAEAAVITDLNSLPTPTIYTVNFVAGQTEAVDQVIIPSKGTIMMCAVANTYTDVAMYNGATEVGYGMYLSNSGTVSSYDFSFPAATTATIKFTRSSSSAETEGIVQYYMYFVNSDNTSLSAKQTTTLYSQNNDDSVYTKIKVTKTGYIKVETPGEYSVYVTLCNSKKNAVSENIYASSTSPATYFAVSKGTYYIKTSSGSGNLYNLKYSFTQVNEKSGSKKSKAVNLKKNKTIKGVLTANNKSQTDWYKIKLTKRQAVKFSIKSFSTNSDIKLQIVPADGSYMYGNTVTLYSEYSQKPESVGKWSAGTYYLKVTKKNKKASGYYQIKWN